MTFTNVRSFTTLISLTDIDTSPMVPLSPNASTEGAVLPSLAV